MGSAPVVLLGRRYMLMYAEKSVARNMLGCS